MLFFLNAIVNHSKLFFNIKIQSIGIPVTLKVVVVSVMWGLFVVGGS